MSNSISGNSSQIEISVIILTYNSSLNKIIYSLESVLRQTGVVYEIIVSDDGSVNNHFYELRDYFNEDKRNRIKLIAHNENHGTVNNFLSAIEYASGKYIKGLGAGDLLYNPTTLKRIVGAMESTGGKIGFGKMQSFSWRAGSFYLKESSFVPRSFVFYPRGISYKDVSYELLQGDAISGASMFFERAFLQRELEQLAGEIIFADDLLRILAIIKREKFVVLNEIVVWYEYASGGISTSNDSAWKEKLDVDYKKFTELLKHNYQYDIYAQKYIKNQSITTLKNPLIRKIRLVMENPYLIVVKMLEWFHIGIAKKDICEDAFLYSDQFITDINSSVRSV